MYTPENKDQYLFHTPQRSEITVGTVEVMLNSEFTGGELQIISDGHTTELKTRPYSWVAVHADVQCGVLPVASGTRVSLIYDVVAVTQVGQPLLTVVGDYNCHRWDEKIFDGLKMSKDVNLPYLVELRPDLIGKRHLVIDAKVFNPTTLTAIAKEAQQSGLLERLFHDKLLDIRPTHLAIHRMQECGTNGNHISDGRGKGYLGTLVVMVGPICLESEAHFSRAGTVSVHVDKLYYRWYAYAAGTTHKLKPMVYGARISLQYDIYDAGSTAPLHDPFQNSKLSYTKVITRSTVPDTLRLQAFEAVAVELAKADCVVITLQYLYPTEKIHPDALIGGDRALYDILTCRSDSRRGFEVHFVNVTLQYHHDQDSDMAAVEHATYSGCSSVTNPMQQSTENTKFIVPTYLTCHHRAERNADISGPYFVKGLCVSRSKF